MYKHKGFYNGTPNPSQQRSLRKHRHMLVEQLNSKEIIDFMFLKSILNSFDKFKLDKALSSRDQNSTLVDILFNKTPEAFQFFLQGLQDTGQRQLYDVLCLGDDTEETAAESGADHDQAQSADHKEHTTAPGEVQGMAVASQSPLSVSPPDQQHLHFKVSHLEERVDQLAESVDGLQTQLHKATEVARENEEKREARHEELKKALQTRETLLELAASQIQDLNSKIDMIQKQKEKALDEASNEMQRLNQELRDQKEKKQRLDEKVQLLTEENEALKTEIENITKEKAAVQKELAKQAQRMTAMERENVQLKKKVSDNEQSLQLVINKVETLQMTVESDNNRKPKRVHTYMPNRVVGRAVPHPKPNTARPRTGQPKPQPPAEPRRQTTAKPNSKRA